VVNAKIATINRFSPDEATANRKIADLWLALLGRSLTVATMVGLAHNVASRQPMTGLRVLNITLAVAALLHALISAQFARDVKEIWDYVQGLSDVSGKLAGHQTIIAKRLAQIEARRPDRDSNPKGEDSK
jgi:hypothetical protein